MHCRLKHVLPLREQPELRQEVFVWKSLNGSNRKEKMYVVADNEFSYFLYKFFCRMALLIWWPWNHRVWFLRVIMSSSHALSCLPSVPRGKNMTYIFSFNMYNKTIILFLVPVFGIFRIIKVSERVISVSLQVRLVTLTSTLIILEITKTSSNNCILCISRKYPYSPYKKGLEFLVVGAL